MPKCIAYVKDHYLVKLKKPLEVGQMMWYVMCPSHDLAMKISA